MLRKLFTIVFVLTSLSAQASSAFACRVIGQVVAQDCCCDQHHEAMPAPAPDEPPCCERITLVGAETADLAATATTAKSASPDIPQPLLAAALPARVAVATRLLPHHRAAEPPPGHSGSRTYLHTQRLRI